MGLRSGRKVGLSRSLSQGKMLSARLLFLQALYFTLTGAVGSASESQDLSFRGELFVDPTKTVSSAYFLLPDKSGVQNEDFPNPDHFGFILNRNEILGDLVLEMGGGRQYELPVHIDLGGIGATVFARIENYNRTIGLRNLQGKRVSDIFDTSYLGGELGLDLGMGFSFRGAVNSTRIVLTDLTASFFALGVDLSMVRIDVFPLDEALYDQLRNLEFE